MAYKEVGIIHGYSDGFLTGIGCFCSISNCIGRMSWGALYEKYPFKNLYSTLLIGQTFFPLTLSLVSPHKYAFALWVVSTVFFSAGNFTIFPPFATKVFGMNFGGAVYSYLTSSFAVASIILFFGNIYILPSLGYDNLLFGAGLLSASNYLLLYSLDENPRWPVTTVTLMKSGIDGSPTNKKPFMDNDIEMRPTGPARVMSLEHNRPNI